MSITISIGEKFWNEELSSWDVQRETSPEAPVFPNDVCLEPKANWRFVNYPAWKSMAEEVGLTKWLTDKDTGILHKNDEVTPITEDHYRMISEAYLLRSAFAEGRPGWDSEEWDEETLGARPQVPGTHYDKYLARLMWLRFWVRWALDHCQEPSVVVSW
jgi:hypothetical protein